MYFKKADNYTDIYYETYDLTETVAILQILCYVFFYFALLVWQ